MEQILLKKDNSDFYKSGLPNEIFLNDEKINNSNTFYYRIDPYFDLDSDLKLGSKSLLLKYLEVELENMEYNDNFEIIKKGMQALNGDYFTQKIITNESMEIRFKLENITLKTIFKLLEGELFYNDLNANVYDLSYNDLIILQLLVIKKMMQRINKEIILIFDGYVDDELIDYLENNVVGSRIKLLIFSNNFHKMKNRSDYYFINNHNIDLSNEIDICNDIMMNLPYHLEEEMIDELLSNYIGGKYDSKIIELMKIL